MMIQKMKSHFKRKNMNKHPTISKVWLKKKYWDEQKTDSEIAKIRKVPITYIQDLIKKYDLSKKKNGIKLKGKKGYSMPENEKQKHRVQPHAKEIAVFKINSFKPIGTYRSINYAAQILNICRNHIKDCLNPNIKRWSSKGYRFEYKKYKGEIIVERRNNLDFTQSFEQITNGLTARLPEYPYLERIAYYNKKINTVWQKLGLKDD